MLFEKPDLKKEQHRHHEESQTVEGVVGVHEIDGSQGQEHDRLHEIQPVGPGTHEEQHRSDELHKDVWIEEHRTELPSSELEDYEKQDRTCKKYYGCI